MPPEPPTTGRGLLDTSRPDDAHTAQRLTDEPVVWFGSTRPDGRPHHVPVWFWWHDPEMVIFSTDGAQKLHNIDHTPSVALHLDAAQGGRDIVLAEGTATVVEDEAVDHMVDGFATKYASVLGPAGFPAWRATFSQPVLITLSRVIAWTRTDGHLAYRSAP